MSLVMGVLVSSARIYRHNRLVHRSGPTVCVARFARLGPGFR